MKKIVVPVGAKFGRLTVLEDGSPGKWVCSCECGVVKHIYSGSIRKGAAISCGCAKRDSMKIVATTHGMSGTPTHAVWKSMRQRCSGKWSSRNACYSGVVCCERWANYALFLADMGERPEGMTLDRISNAKGYEPDNCRWATPKEQAVNRSITIMLEFEGCSMCAADWSRKIGISRKGLMKRLKLGWELKDALTTPKYGGRK